MFVFKKAGRNFCLLFLYLLLMNKVLKIFDMDRTLIDTPDFTHFINVNNDNVIDTDKYFPEQFKAVKSIFWDTLMTEVILKKEGNSAVIVNSKNNLPFDEN